MMAATGSSWRANVSLAVALAVGACGGDAADVAAVPAFRDYEGQFVYRLKPILSANPDTIVTNCEGRVSIAEPALGDVSGTFLVETRQGACIGAGDVIGSIYAEGDIIVTLSTAGRPPDELFPAFGCRPIDGYRDFAGTITDRELMLETDFVAVCPVGGSTFRAQWLVSFRGER